MLEESLERLKAEFAELERQLSDPAVVADQERYRDLTRRHAELASVMGKVSAIEVAARDLAEAQDLLASTQDEDEETFLSAERDAAAQRKAQLEQEILHDLLPKDPQWGSNAIVEVRAGTGGEEAALFAGDLFDMYTRFAERHRWPTEVMDSSPSEYGGWKEIVFAVNGKGAYGTLRHEQGVHRVQRVPQTESQGRIHTSAATVAVLPEVEDTQVQLDLADCEFQAMRASGPGGQHMQKNETAVRVVHKPTGIVVKCQNERSQHQNREQALRILRARLAERERQRQQEEVAEARRAQVKSGDRSEKIRTYNFPQDRVTDHRIGLTLHNLSSVLEGNIEELLSQLRAADDARRLAELTQSAPAD